MLLLLRLVQSCSSCVAQLVGRHDRRGARGGDRLGRGMRVLHQELVGGFFVSVDSGDNGNRSQLGGPVLRKNLVLNLARGCLDQLGVYRDIVLAHSGVADEEEDIIFGHTIPRRCVGGLHPECSWLGLQAAKV